MIKLTKGMISMRMTEALPILCAVIILTCCAASTAEPVLAYGVNGDPITDPRAGYLEDGWWQISGEVVTPHQPFAKPYIAGAVNVLVICPYVDARVACELEQRFDCNVDVLMTVDHQHVFAENDNWHRRPFLRPFKEAEISNLDMTRYGAILIGGQQWEAFPFELKYKILKAAAEGAGLVILPYRNGKTREVDTSAILSKVFSVPKSDHGYIAGGIPFAKLPGLGLPKRGKGRQKSPEEVVQTFQFKQGRAVILDYRPEYNSCLAADRAPNEFIFDFYMAFIGRALLWSSGKTPAVTITQTSIDADAIVNPALTENIKLTVQNNGVPVQLQVKVVVRADNHRYSRPVAETIISTQIASGRQNLSVAAPPLPHGEAAVDIILTSPGDEHRAQETLDWCSRLITVNRSERHIADIAIPDGINLPDATVPISFVMTGLPVPDLYLDIRVEDVYKRLLLEQSYPVHDQAEIQADIFLAQAIGSQVWVDATLRRAGKIIQTISRRVHRADTTTPDFTVFAWAGGFYINDNSPWSRQAYRTIKATGINAVQPPLVFWQNDPQVDDRGIMASDAGLKVVPMITRIIGQKNANGPVPADNIGVGGFTDPEAFQGNLERAVTIARSYAKFGAPFYNIGDENGIHFTQESDLCWRPGTLDKFRAAMKEIYASLARLNQEWETNFATWEMVEPSTLAQARESGQYAAWADFRAFMESLLADSHRQVNQAIRAAGIPDAKTCIDGLSDFRHGLGHDVTKLPGTVAECSPYDKNLSLSLVRDLNPRVGVMPTMGVYSSRPPPFEHFLWEALSRGAGTCLFWNVYTAQNWTCGIMPDLRPTVALQNIGRNCQELNRGPARLIQQAEMQYSPVAVLYSRMSIRAGDFIDKGMGTVYDSMRVFVPGASEYFGLNPRFISESMLLDPQALAEIRILILPVTQAMSAVTAQAIMNFVEQGGHVIADARPGVFTEHCRSRTNGILDDLFGVQQAAQSNPVNEVIEVEWFDSTASQQQSVDAMLQDAAISGSKIKVASQACLTADASLETTTGSPELVLPDSKTPVLIRNSYGKGTATLLNLKNCPELLPLWERLVSAIGIAPPVQITSGGKGIRGYRYSQFVDRNVEYVMLFEGPECEALVQLPRKAYIYESRTGGYHGFADSVILPRLDVPWMLSLLPAKVQDVSVELPARVLAGETLSGSFNFNRSEAHNWRQAASVQLYAPGDKLLQHYQTVVDTETGSGRFSIPLALNEMPGIYRVTVTDAATGVNGTATLSIAANGKDNYAD